jgi:HEAT repeats
MPSVLTQELIDSLLRQQAEEFVTDFDTGNYLLSSTITGTPESELLRAGRRLIVSPDAAARILGTRLVRGLTALRTQAAADLGDLLRYEQDEDVICWIVGAFGTLNSESVTDELVALAAHPDPAIRYHTAAALVNRTAGDLPSAAFDTLLTLCTDDDAEVRFSAVFELGNWWQASHDVRAEAVLRRAIRDNDPFVFRAARDALSEDHMA